MRSGWTLILPMLGTAFAAQAMSDREATMDQDFQGPRVEWEGRIVGRVSEGGDTCFVLERVDSWQDSNGEHFIACNHGPFDVRRFGQGQAMRVTGNLGEATPRRIGDQVWDYPLIAGAILRRISDPAPAYHGYPFYDPVYAPVFYYGRGWY